MSGVSLTVSSTAICTHAGEKERIRNTHIFTFAFHFFILTLTSCTFTLTLFPLSQPCAVLLGNWNGSNENISNITVTLSDGKHVRGKYEFKFGLFSKAWGFALKPRI